MSFERIVLGDHMSLTIFSIYYLILTTTDLINPSYNIHCPDFTNIRSLPIAVVHCCFRLEASGEN